MLPFNKGGIRLLGEVLKQELKLNTKDSKAEIAKINYEIEKQNTRLKNARSLMLDGELTAQEYKEMKIEIEDLIKSLSRQQSQLKVTDENLTEQIDFCVALLSNIDQIYDVADITTKQQIIGSIFPEKLIIDNNKCRTANIEEAVKLLCFNNEHLSGSKNGKHPINKMLSVEVHMKGLEPPPLRTRS
jgi:site-specific DNA recombinase